MIPLPLKPKVTKTGENKACFEISALYPGYGTTIGNSLRRVLLSSLEGAAITQVKIKGVQHEFSTIPGVLEDIVMIINNLKKVRFKLYGDEPQIGIIKAKGEKEINGKDIELPSQVEVVNKDIHLAALTTKKAELEIEIQIEKGIGYEPAERRKKEKLEIGVIVLDAIFSSVKRISYKVENMRVGERTDFDKLILEIETDGAITPEQAFQQALEILIKHFSLFVDEKKEEIKEKKEEKEKPKKPKKIVKTKKTESKKKTKIAKTKEKSKKKK
ncbi:DNA-directed RNA polymerase subunit alpha [Candidatus Parcubacteria bacterium]|nr:DNA-directed RNA polymerase subunit alpha [Candidatus Parcubacteria bacterium]